jgi:hypothetical protein
MMPKFQIGDRVVKNPDNWKPSEFDSWGAGVGVGIVVKPPFALEDGVVDVRWPGGRCFQNENELLPVP